MHAKCVPEVSTHVAHISLIFFFGVCDKFFVLSAQKMAISWVLALRKNTEEKVAKYAPEGLERDSNESMTAFLGTAKSP